jgi:hypothetical protein
MNRIKELPNSLNSLPMHIVPPLLITKKKITKRARTFHEHANKAFHWTPEAHRESVKAREKSQRHVAASKESTD